MKVLRIILFSVIGLVGGYSVGIQRVGAQECESLKCELEGVVCQSYEYFCAQTCLLGPEGPGGECEQLVGRCYWEPPGPICSWTLCSPNC